MYKNGDEHGSGEKNGGNDDADGKKNTKIMKMMMMMMMMMISMEMVRVAIGPHGASSNFLLPEAKVQVFGTSGQASRLRNRYVPW
ncbi:hypothetical protein RRG08_054801 [Elysia crispata]|uniref:Uncharacterized protein n=1 Tax=Elysia crispata TaxID=231223 RepID=A0AAE0YFP1_9GAST|nr:hypothetical protein RRG08_054801 [Elysia crispata]